MDVNSFVDFQIINELANNVDGYRFSTFFYKKKDSDGANYSPVHCGILTFAMEMLTMTINAWLLTIGYIKDMARVVTGVCTGGRG